MHLNFFIPRLWQAGRRSTRRWAWGVQLVLVICALAVWGSPAQAKDHIVARSWLSDPSGDLSWAQVQTLTSTPYQGTLSQGFGDSVIWLRLRIDPQATTTPTSSQDRLILRIRPVYLDDIRVYDPLVTGGLVGITGDVHHPRESEFHGLDFLLPIARGTQPRDIWLRMASTSTRQIDVQALNIDELNVRSHSQSLLFSAYVGLVAILAIWGLIHWLFSREPVIGAFALMQTCALLFALSSLGHLRAIWQAQWPAWILHEATSVFSILAVSSAEWFHVQLIREFRPPLWIRRLHWGFMALLPIKLGLVMLGMNTLALQLNMNEIMLAALVFMASVLLAKGWQDVHAPAPTLSRPVVLGFYALLLLVILGAVLPALGIVQSSEVALYIVQLHGLVTAFLVLLMLQYRAHVRNQQQNETRMALQRSLLQNQQERTIREEQDKLLTMLAHELKTPLATMHMRLDDASPGSQEIKQAIRDMNNVIDRCQQSLQLDDRQLVMHMESINMVGVVRNCVAACGEPERFDLDLPEQMVIQTDPQLCSIVLNNLIENACKYAAPNSRIRIHLQLDSQGHAASPYIRMEIVNAPGQAGWPDAHQVFDKYYRSPHARRQAGTGLGLFLVKNLVQALQGQIDYKPSDNAIRFELLLPR